MAVMSLAYQLCIVIALNKHKQKLDKMEDLAQKKGLPN